MATEQDVSQVALMLITSDGLQDEQTVVHVIDHTLV